MFRNQSYQALHLARHFKVHPFIPFIIAIPPLLSIYLSFHYILHMHGAKCERFTYVSFKFPNNPGQILAEAYTYSTRHYSNISASLSYSYYMYM